MFCQSDMFLDSPKLFSVDSLKSKSVVEYREIMFPYDEFRVRLGGIVEASRGTREKAQKIFNSVCRTSSAILARCSDLLLWTRYMISFQQQQGLAFSQC